VIIGGGRFSCRARNTVGALHTVQQKPQVPHLSLRLRCDSAISIVKELHSASLRSAISMVLLKPLTPAGLQRTESRLLSSQLCLGLRTIIRTIKRAYVDNDGIRCLQQRASAQPGCAELGGKTSKSKPFTKHSNPFTTTIFKRKPNGTYCT
jgi:hypothetical protein